MPGRGFGYGLGAAGSTRRHRPASGGTPTPSPTPSAGFTMTQLAAVKRVYQRDTLTGGGENKGQGIIRVALSGATAGTVSARIRASDGSTILQPEWSIGSIAGGASHVDVTGVDARVGWFYVDLNSASGWQNGTVLVGMGGLALWWGQSGVVDMVTKVHDTATIASTGIGVPTNAAVLASWSDSAGFSNTAGDWLAVTDAAQANGVVNSAGAAEYLNRMIALTGVNWGIIGHSVGATAIGEWLPGEAHHVELLRVLALAGGKAEVEYFGQGAGDSFLATEALVYKARLTTMFASVHVNNGFAAPAVLVDSIRNMSFSGFGSTIAKEVIQRASYEWAIEQGHIPLIYRDGELAGDGAHYLQTGNLRTARHMYRALRPIYGAAHKDMGSIITGATRSGVNIVLSYDRAPGASAMSAIGSPGSRFKVYHYGTREPLALDGATPFTLDDVARTITLKLAADPGPVELEVVPFGLLDAANDGHADGLYDDLTDDDGIAEGRALFPAPVLIRTATNRDLTITAAAYGSGNGKFGDTLSAGSGVTSTTRNLPGYVSGATLECWVRLDATDGSGIRAFCGEPTLLWFGCQNNELWAGYGASFGQIGSGLLPTNQWIHLAMVLNSGASAATIYVNGSAVATPATTGWPNPGSPSAFGVRCYGAPGSAGLVAGQLVDEIAVFEGQRYTANFTPPAAPYVGDEPGLIMLYHLAGNGLNSALSA